MVVLTFAAMGMGMGVLGRYIRLRRRGITLSRLLGGESAPRPDGDPRSKPARIAEASCAAATTSCAAAALSR